MNINEWLKQNTADLTDKTIAITGSTGDIATCLLHHICQLNGNLILINRNKEKTENQIKELTLVYPNSKIEFIQCDLADFNNVKKASRELKQKHIDILYLCAGAYNIPRYITELAYDNIFQINFISQCYMAKELINNIKAVNGKIVAVSSIAHNYSKIDINDIDFSKQKKASKVYGNAKRFLTFYLMELCKKHNVNLAIVHPGLTLTTMTNHYPKAINWLVKIFIGMFCPNPQKASLSLVKGVFENTEYHQWIGPPIFQVYGKPKKIKLKTCNQSESQQIFEIGEEIFTHIKNKT